MIDFNQSLQIAKSAALLAGDFLLKAQGSDLKILLNQDRDLKLQLDIDTEKIIKDYISSHSNYSILGEETGLSDKLGEFFWVIDPLDGTSNYFRGLPACCVSIALLNKDEAFIGVIYDFNEGDLYYSLKGEGAFKNGEKITVSEISSKEKASLTTGIPFSKDIEMTQEYIEFLRPWKKVRMFGSAALSCAYVASGKCDFYHEKGVYLWDFAAGISLVQEAGGNVQSKEIDDNRYEVIITNGKL